jgi:hypothetical protein
MPRPIPTLAAVGALMAAGVDSEDAVIGDSHHQP